MRCAGWRRTPPRRAASPRCDKIPGVAVSCLMPCLSSRALFMDAVRWLEAHSAEARRIAEVQDHPLERPAEMGS